eukprot:Lithocolla_globosa_v1_NODE_191_length_5320_cov_8.118139.p4 type:complete len:132 gc:universal NODE_191_length_5320_cov_8.118139:223-618(+)
MGKKWIAIRNGEETGLFEGWDACKHHVKGYSDAEFKGFNKKEEALQYLLSAEKPNQGLAKKYLEEFDNGKHLEPKPSSAKEVKPSEKTTSKIQQGERTPERKKRKRQPEDHKRKRRKSARGSWATADVEKD